MCAYTNKIRNCASMVHYFWTSRWRWILSCPFLNRHGFKICAGRDSGCWCSRGSELWSWRSDSERFITSRDDIASESLIDRRMNLAQLIDWTSDQIFPIPQHIMHLSRKISTQIIYKTALQEHELICVKRGGLKVIFVGLEIRLIAKNGPEAVWQRILFDKYMRKVLYELAGKVHWTDRLRAYWQNRYCIINIHNACYSNRDDRIIIRMHVTSIRILKTLVMKYKGLS